MPSWDEEFSKPGYRYGTEPNSFLVEMAGRLPAGARVIAAGDGEGRNGVWLATEGHHGLALDASAVGLAKALAQPGTSVRIFGKPEVKGHRRMAVALATGRNIAEARRKAMASAKQLKVR